MNYRLKELDFLRGIAIILVLLRHVHLFDFTTKMGWIGVDLFFVLSGFLVSSLLFKEYIKFGNIKPKLFLIRRGFKIYPIYYIFYLPYLTIILYQGKFNFLGFMTDMTFTQNYLWGWGYAFPASWSLAVEEHFYFGLSFFLWLLLRFKPNFIHTRRFVIVIICILILCFIQRLVANTFFSTHSSRLFTLTQFRIDSLLCGVLISFFFHFKHDQLKFYFEKNRIILLTISIFALSWTPFIDPIPSFFVKTTGFSLLYISFGILLLSFLLIDNMVVRLNNVFTKPMVDLISKIGFSSYSIYIIHTLILFISPRFLSKLHIIQNKYSLFFVEVTVSIIAGMVMTYTVEKYFLKMRDNFFPSRA